MQSNFIIKDYYALLGIQQNAAVNEIKSAFRTMAMKTHPDATKMSGSYEKFILIREAYDILSDKTKRREYDSLLQIYRQYNTRTGKSTDDYFKDAFENFTSDGNTFYKDEWDYFVKNPEEYLSLFESVRKVLATSLFSFLSGFFTTLFTFGLLLISVAFFITVLFVVVAALLSSSLASIVLVIITIHMYRFMKKRIQNLKLRFIDFVSDRVILPLEGIPRHIGKWFLYFNYLCALASLLFFGYKIFFWAFNEFHHSKTVYGVGCNYGIYFHAISAFIVVVLFSVSLPIVFEMIKRALFKYPIITYTRITIKHRTMIVYKKDRALPERHEDCDCK